MDQPKETEMAGNPRLYSSWAIFCRHGNGEAAMEKNEAAMGNGDPPWELVTRHGACGTRISEKRIPSLFSGMESFKPR